MYLFINEYWTNLNFDQMMALDEVMESLKLLQFMS